MAARTLASSTITFGLVAVPVQLYPATRASAGLAFHFLHAKDKVRLRQQLVCPKDGEVVPRKDAVRGYEHTKDAYVVFTDEELEAVDQRASAGIEVAEFVPQASLAPVYVDRCYFLGPGKGGDRAFALLVAALEEKELVAICQYAARGKDYLVALRPFEGRLLMQQLFHEDEVRPVSEVPVPDSTVKAPELKLARELVDQLTSERFEPAGYEDAVRKRVQALIDEKVKGGDVTAAEPSQPARVIDLMAALKASLAEQRRGPKEESKAARRGKAARLRKAG